MSNIGIADMIFSHCALDRQTSVIISVCHAINAFLPFVKKSYKLRRYTPLSLY